MHADDWTAVAVILWYTLLIVSMNEIIPRGYNYMSDAEVASLTPHEREVRSDGGKWVMVSEEMMVLTVWSCKVCMLLIYKRFTYATLESTAPCD